MKKNNLVVFVIAIVMLFTGCGGSKGSENSGTVTKLIVNSEAIAKNLVGESSDKSIQIYLPSKYDESDKKYPVLYFLAGFGDTTDVWFDGAYEGLRINESMENMIAAGTSKEMIVVVISGTNCFGGSFYANSPITGNWEYFVVKEVVAKTDSTYRTIKSKNSRGIAGHSMGGYGALNIAMKYPDIFSTVYALSPGLFDNNGLKNFLFSSDSAKNELINRKKNYDEMTESNMINARNSLINDIKIDNWRNIKYVYGFAFAGNSVEKTYLDTPYYSENGIIKENSTLAKWENGYGNITGKIADYKSKNEKLKAIGFEVGNSDEYDWLIRGCDYLDAEMKSAGITAQYTKFAGQHQDRLKERFENYVVPFLNANLEF